ncbi:ABC transporter permease subunit, partial [Chromobacterium haemolyticum]
MDIFLQQILNGLVLGSIYALIALGYTMVYGIMGLINFAHGEVVMFGAMVTISVINALSGSGLPGPALVLIGLLVAIAACMLLGFTVERIAYRPLRGKQRLAPLITAIGLSIVLQQVAILIWGRNYIPFPQILDHDVVSFFGASITKLQITIIVLCLVIMAGLLLM